ncbi:hypothetical protein COW99_01290 [Candidatus Roizmanbacteria bacterium CG22_combo_CG10-13_8_21_14_all_38_20]|uniref:Uncharacterized protein n=1 Tax=Candidatus Roizmanbacteria bacterium CG22_combo_CG10-13_8_21_14_all_38_20 TaxID=1974862 RepID=A0A2H0BWG1_9BACT|nr:hypothetical protein [Candidatus Microgenomates bacterium]PIP62017.1 MAG: hypothetical protein COW99_01290 [Candidatus Roizmanbacteria bacterium CG22_combo_CG10-13_8_21_14_all_38_20]PJC31324.1 MAG: hypothetical protein CO050_03605 [Candidatus Roizmanbacteria bacterium CG_4_9_14_0_2_um_filter_38_17]
MLFKLQKYVFDEKDAFLVLFGSFLLGSNLFTISTAPFRFDSLVTLFLFLLVSRITSAHLQSFTFYAVILIGLYASILLSPATLALFYLIFLLALRKLFLM